MSKLGRTVYYALYPGDFLADISDLGNTELGIYWRLILNYYQHRRPLLGDLLSLYRTAMAFTPEEQDATRKVIERFFYPSTEPKDGGKTVLVYRQKRCDLELEEADKRYESAVARTAKAREIKIKNSKTSVTDFVTDSVTSSVKGSVTGGESESESELELELEKPKVKDTVGKKTSDIPHFFEIEKKILDFLNEKTGRAYRPVAVNLEFIRARLKEGYTEDECRMVIAKKAREWLGDDAMAVYLRPATLFNRTKFNQYIGECVVQSAD